MAGSPLDPKSSGRSASEDADLHAERQNAKAGYQGKAPVANMSDALKQRNGQRAERERQAAKVHYMGSNRSEAAAEQAEGGAVPIVEGEVDFKFTQTGKYLIAAGSERIGVSSSFCPVLYISVIGEKDWATRYPMRGSHGKADDALAAALHYGIQIITRQAKDVQRPGEAVSSTDKTSSR